jgi:hypothetical protein
MDVSALGLIVEEGFKETPEIGSTSIKSWGERLLLSLPEAVILRTF